MTQFQAKVLVHFNHCEMGPNVYGAHYRAQTKATQILMIDSMGKRQLIEI